MNNINNFENSMNKILLHTEKCNNIINCIKEKEEYDVSPPICIELHLTNKCNLNCDWCIDKKLRKNNEEIPLKSLLSLLDNIEGRNVGLTIEGGGEPTMHSQFSDFIQECYKRKIQVGLITNGTNRIDRDLIKCFSYIRVSVDAATENEYIIEKGRNLFNTVMDNLLYIRENNKEVVLGISYVLNNRNSQNLEQLFRKVKDLNLNFIRLRNVEENASLSLSAEMMGNIKKNMENWSLLYKVNAVMTKSVETNITNNDGLPCIAHSLRALIVANGDVFMCAKRRHDPIVIGNVNKDEFMSIWTSERRKEASLRFKEYKMQEGCAFCRITKYNELFVGLSEIKTGNFI